MKHEESNSPPNYNHLWKACLGYENRLASARAIMQRFVDKVDTGRARSKETYGEMKQWMEDE